MSRDPDKYELIKEGAKNFRNEVGILMKPRGFKVGVRVGRVGGYWNEAKIKVDVKTPKWFKWYTDSTWNKTDKAKKMVNVFHNRLVNLILEESSKSKLFKWEYNDEEATYDDINDSIIFEHTFNGYN